VESLTVYAGPGEQFEHLGGLPYGAFVYPLARTGDGIWLQIEYAGFEGWIPRRWVDMAYDVVFLPVPPGYITPVLGSDNLTLTPSAGTPVPDTPPTDEPTASPLPLLPSEPEAAEASAAIPPASATPLPEPVVEEATPQAPGSAPGLGLGRVILIAAGIVGLALSARYLFSARASAIYQGGEFVIARCPVCGEGHLSLEDMGRSRRVVRCDNCRSVLRQLRSGLWRYAVDPLPDREFADRYNGEALGEDQLKDIAAQRARERAAKE
jgi:hypothetical protein